MIEVLHRSRNGLGILEHGVEELMRREREFNDAYS
jgi:hypothetical protein